MVRICLTNSFVYCQFSVFSSQLANGAEDGIRTLVASLEGWSSTIELHPRQSVANSALLYVIVQFTSIVELGRVAGGAHTPCLNVYA